MGTRRGSRGSRKRTGRKGKCAESEECKPCWGGCGNTYCCTLWQGTAGQRDRAAYRKRTPGRAEAARAQHLAGQAGDLACPTHASQRYGLDRLTAYALALAFSSCGSCTTSRCSSLNSSCTLQLLQGTTLFLRGPAHVQTGTQFWWAGRNRSTSAHLATTVRGHIRDLGSTQNRRAGRKTGGEAKGVATSAAAPAPLGCAHHLTWHRQDVAKVRGVLSAAVGAGRLRRGWAAVAGSASSGAQLLGGPQGCGALG